MKIRLSKALVFKKRIGAKIAELQAKIQSYNSYQEGYEPQDDVSFLSEDLKRFQILQVKLKTLIYSANIPIIELLYSMIELKNRLAFETTLPTKSGKFKEAYSDDKDVVYVSTISKDQVEANKKSYQKNIDKSQEEIDAYNASTFIDVPPEFDDLFESI